MEVRILRCRAAHPIEQGRASTARCGPGRSRCHSSLATERSPSVPKKSMSGARVVPVRLAGPAPSSDQRVSVTAASGRERGLQDRLD